MYFFFKCKFLVAIIFCTCSFFLFFIAGFYFNHDNLLLSAVLVVIGIFTLTFAIALYLLLFLSQEKRTVKSEEAPLRRRVRFSSRLQISEIDSPVTEISDSSEEENDQEQRRNSGYRPENYESRQNLAQSIEGTDMLNGAVLFESGHLHNNSKDTENDEQSSTAESSQLSLDESSAFESQNNPAIEAHFNENSHYLSCKIGEPSPSGAQNMENFIENEYRETIL